MSILTENHHKTIRQGNSQSLPYSPNILNEIFKWLYRLNYQSGMEQVFLWAIKMYACKNLDECFFQIYKNSLIGSKTTPLPFLPMKNTMLVKTVYELRWFLISYNFLIRNRAWVSFLSWWKHHWASIYFTTGRDFGFII